MKYAAHLISIVLLLAIGLITALYFTPHLEDNESFPDSLSISTLDYDIFEYPNPYATQANALNTAPKAPVQKILRVQPFVLGTHTITNTGRSDGEVDKKIYAACAVLKNGMMINYLNHLQLQIVQKEKSDSSPSSPRWRYVNTNEQINPQQIYEDYTYGNEITIPSKGEFSESIYAYTEGIYSENDIMLLSNPNNIEGIRVYRQTNSISYVANSYNDPCFAGYGYVFIKEIKIA